MALSGMYLEEGKGFEPLELSPYWLALSRFRPLSQPSWEAKLSPRSDIRPRPYSPTGPRHVEGLYETCTHLYTRLQRVRFLLAQESMLVRGEGLEP